MYYKTDILVPLLLLWSCNINTYGRNFTASKCSTWRKIAGTCSTCKTHCRFPRITTEHDYNTVVDAMKARNMTVTWLGLQRVWLGEFVWLDCTKSFKPFAGEKWPLGANCASLNVRDVQLEAAGCELRNRGAICQVKDCRSCSHIRHQTNCWKVNDTCYIKLENPMNWETARVACKIEAEGGKLAIFTADTQVINILSRKIQESPFINYWIGLRREEWTYEESGSEALDIQVVRWDKNQPSPHGNCSIMVKTGREYLWRVSNCKANYNALCIKTDQHLPREYFGHSIPLQYPTERYSSAVVHQTKPDMNYSNELTLSKSDNILIGVAVSFGILLIIILIISALTTRKVYKQVDSNIS